MDKIDDTKYRQLLGARKVEREPSQEKTKDDTPKPSNDSKNQDSSDVEKGANSQTKPIQNGPSTAPESNQTEPYRYRVTVRTSAKR